MSIFSKPVYSLAGLFFEQLFNHPVRTKSITSSVLAATANYTAQRIGNEDGRISRESVLAYALFGLVFGGSVPHYFYQLVERLFEKDLKFRKFFQFFAERLVFAPFYQALSLYFLSRFEMNSHEVAIANLNKLYWPLLKTNWKYFSVAVLLNMTFVPPVLRTITMSFVSFLWVIYVAHKRRQNNVKPDDVEKED